MSETTRLHNPGATELVYDGQGHLLAVGEGVDVTGELDPVTRRLVNSGRLVIVRPPLYPVLSAVRDTPEPAPEPEPEVKPAKKTAPRRKASGVTQKGKI